MCGAGLFIAYIECENLSHISWSGLNVLFHLYSKIIESKIFIIGNEVNTFGYRKLKGGTAPPTQKLTCFVLYLKIISPFLKNNICMLQ